MIKGQKLQTHSIQALGIANKMVIGYIEGQKNADYKLHSCSVVQDSSSVAKTFKIQSIAAPTESNTKIQDL